MEDYQNQSILVNPQRENLPSSKPREWIEVATAAIVLISAIVSLIDRDGGSGGGD